MKDKIERCTVLTFKAYYKDTVNKSVLIQGYTNRRLSPEIDPHVYSVLIFKKGEKIFQCRKNNSLSVNVATIAILCKN